MDNDNLSDWLGQYRTPEIEGITELRSRRDATADKAVSLPDAVLSKKPLARADFSPAPIAQKELKRSPYGIGGWLLWPVLIMFFVLSVPNTANAQPTREEVSQRLKEGNVNVETILLGIAKGTDSIKGKMIDDATLALGARVSGKEIVFEYQWPKMDSDKNKILKLKEIMTEELGNKICSQAIFYVLIREYGAAVRFIYFDKDNNQLFDITAKGNSCKQ